MSELPAVTLLGQTVHRVTLKEASATIECFADSGVPRLVAAKNVSVLVACDRDAHTHAFYERCDLVTVDGRPLVYLSRLLRRPLPEMVGGPALWWRSVESAARRGFSVYFIGGAPGVAEEAARRLRERYPSLQVLGTRDGHSGMDNGGAAAARAAIERRPAIVLVGLPYPLRELFAERLMAEGYGGVCVLVGGMFDVFAGRRSLAPSLISRLCLEWLYRAAQEPRRLGLRYLRDGAALGMLLLRRVLGGAGGGSQANTRGG